MENTTAFLSKIKGSYIVIGVIVLLALYVFSTYNTLVKGNLAVDGAWAQVESQYQRRLDLIPNLVASVEGAMTQEKEVFTALADARSKYAGAQSPEQKAEAATQVEGSLGRLLAIVENYPVLKSSDTVITLMAELSGTENRVAVERMRFNEAVGAYNGSIITFPRNIIASVFGFAPRSFFKAASGAENAPKVEFNK